MGSREKILNNISRAKAPVTPLREMHKGESVLTDCAGQFIAILEKIGGRVVEVQDWGTIGQFVSEHFSGFRRIFSNIRELPWFVPQLSEDPHVFEDVDLAVLRGYFGVAENGSVWITDRLMGDRSVPFIAQHLALVINKKDIVPTLHEAYDRIDSSSFEYGTFIAGPSKTADIEQSLVLGAHGPKSMTVFLLA